MKLTKILSKIKSILMPLKNRLVELKKKIILFEIKLGFPLKKEFEEVRIVDTPGVNAIGGVQDITFDYLHEADAIIFLHSVEDAIESKSFQDFTKGVASTRSNEVMFLVLTKAGNRNSREVEAKLKDVISRLGKDTLNPERITYFDSLGNFLTELDRKYSSKNAAWRKQLNIIEEKYDRKALSYIYIGNNLNISTLLLDDINHAVSDCNEYNHNVV